MAAHGDGLDVAIESDSLEPRTAATPGPLEAGGTPAPGLGPSVRAGTGTQVLAVRGRLIHRGVHVSGARVDLVQHGVEGAGTHTPEDPLAGLQEDGRPREAARCAVIPLGPIVRSQRLTGERSGGEPSSGSLQRAVW